jgi:hypothetical protein
MKKLIFSEIKKYLSNKFEFHEYRYSRIKRNLMITFLIYPKGFKNKFEKFNKEHLKELRKIAKKNDYILFLEKDYDYYIKKHGFEMILKKIKHNPVEVPDKLYHLTYKRNRNSILKNGLLTKSFYKSKYKNNPCCYYKPAIFFANKPELMRFLFNKDKENTQIDVWEINTKKLNKNNKYIFFLDCNMMYFSDFYNFFMTYKNIPSDCLKLIKSYKKQNGINPFKKKKNIEETTMKLFSFTDY